MVDIEVGKVAWELLAAAPARVMTTRYMAEVLHDQQADSSAQVQVGKTAWELLSEVPPSVKTTRYVVETVHDQQPDSSADILIGKHSMELMAEVPTLVKTTRYMVETVHDQQADPTADVQVGKVSFELLAKSFTRLEACTTPSFWRYFSHNWAKKFQVTTAYRTAVSRGSESLSEDRTQIWQRPRRTIKIEWAEKGLDDKRNLFDLMQAIRELKKSDWIIPLSSDCALITRDEASSSDFVQGNFDFRRFFLGGSVAIVKFSKGTNDVQDENGDLFGVHLTSLLERTATDEYQLTDALPFSIVGGATFMVPMVCVIPHMLTAIRQHHCRLWQTSFEFTEDGGPTCIPSLTDGNPPNFDTYQDRPIFRPRHDYTNPLNISILQEGTQEVIGRNVETFPRGETERVRHTITMFEERALAWDYITFFETRRGRLRSFWLIDQEMLFTVTDIEVTFVEITALGTFAEFQKDNTHFGFMMKDGTCFVREVVTFDDLGGVWRMTMLDTLPSGLQFQDVVLSGRARDTRMVEDSLTEQWFHGEAVRFTVKTISLLEEKDVTLDP